MITTREQLTRVEADPHQKIAGAHQMLVKSKSIRAPQLETADDYLCVGVVTRCRTRS